MHIVVIGGTGLIGARVVNLLRSEGQRVTAASLETGTNLLTNDGVEEALAGADVLIDVSNAPSFDPAEVMHFFTTATGNLVAAAHRARIAHYVVLSIVGCDRVPANGYFRAKVAQEDLVRASGLPHTILRATQFFEFAAAMADDATRDGRVHVPTAYFQPMAAADVAAALAGCAASEPAGGVREVAGPELVRMSDFIAAALSAAGDPRSVVGDEHATYFGAELDEDSLVPGRDASLASTTYAEWHSATKEVAP